jgi:nitroreductase
MAKDLPGLNPDQLKKLLVTRRSVRRYREEKISKAIIQEILATVAYAPSAVSLHPVTWIIISDPGKIAEIARETFLVKARAVLENPSHGYAPLIERGREAFEKGEAPICRQAPHLIVGTVPKGNPFGPSDAIIALSWFEIAAHSYGIGACWAGAVWLAAEESRKIHDMLGIPEGNTLGCVMVFGYPELPYPNIPPRPLPKVRWLD